MEVIWRSVPDATLSLFGDPVVVFITSKQGSISGERWTIMN